MDTMKKIAVIITIAILFTVFTMSTVEVINQEPKSNDFCEDDLKPHYPVGQDSQCSNFTEPTTQERQECSNKEGRIEYNYENGCPVSFECETCWAEYEKARENHRMIGFIITTILGLIAIIVGLYAQSNNEVVQWILSGFMIGGMISIFVGTTSYFSDMPRFIRPIAMALEIALVSWVAIRTYNKSHKHKKNK